MRQFQPKQSIDTLRIVAPNEKYVQFKFDESGFISTRRDFDCFLFNLASTLPDVDVYLNTAVQTVTRDGEMILIKATDGRTFYSKMVIGCDGASSVVKKFLTSTSIDPSHHAAAVRAYFKNVAGLETTSIELHFLKSLLPSYLWIFPLPQNMANVGLGRLSKTIANKGIRLREELPQILENTPYLQARFENATMVTKVEGYGLPLGSRKVPISGNRFMLCGDAASLVDPLSGEGIGQAMISGRYAGWQALKCFEEDDFSAAQMKNYNRTLYQKLWKTHRKRYHLQRLIGNRSWLLSAAIGLASDVKPVRNFFQHLIW